MSKIQLNHLKYRIGIINPQYPSNEVNNLFPGKSDINAKELYEFLKENEIDDYDPM